MQVFRKIPGLYRFSARNLVSAASDSDLTLEILDGDSKGRHTIKYHTPLANLFVFCFARVGIAVLSMNRPTFMNAISRNLLHQVC